MPQPDSCNAAKARLFDHLVGAGAQGSVFRLLALVDAGSSGHIVGYVRTIEPLEGILSHLQISHIRLATHGRSIQMCHFQT